METPAPAPETPSVSEVHVVAPNGGPQRRNAASIRTYDFRQSGFLAPSELRRIRLRHEQFTRGLAARLGILLRLETALQLTKVQILGYQKFTEGLPAQSHITLFRVEPLKGMGLLILPPRLALALVDRLLGGAGRMPAEPRDLSEIEVALADQVASLLLSEWCVHWPEMRDLRPTLVGHESNGRFLQSAPPDSAMLILTLEAGLGDQPEFIQIAFPYATVEPLMRQLEAAQPKTEPTPARSSVPRWNAEFDEVKVPASAEWQGLRISAAEIARLKTGDVLLLAPGCDSAVQVRLGQVPKFSGRAGVCANRWAVELTAVIDP